jgi:hypothetical protein
MENLQYHHFPRQAEGAVAMVLPVGDHDRIGCFTDQVKLTHALVRDLDEAVRRSSCWESMRKNHARRSWSWRPYARG